MKSSFVCAIMGKCRLMPLQHNIIFKAALSMQQCRITSIMASWCRYTFVFDRCLKGLFYQSLVHTAINHYLIHSLKSLLNDQLLQSPISMLTSCLLLGLKRWTAENLDMSQPYNLCLRAVEIVNCWKFGYVAALQSLSLRDNWNGVYSSNFGHVTAF